MLKRRYTIYLLACLVMALGTACKKVIQVDLNESSSRVVIEGEITNIPGPYQIKITRSIPYSEDNIFPPVTGATVTVKDSVNGITYGFDELSPGIYSTNQFAGIPKHMYKLNVNADNQQYTAISTMPGTVHLDSVTFASNTSFNGKRELNAVANFQDPPELGNYFQFIEFVNGRQIPNIFVFEDRLSNGRYIEQALYNDSAYIQKGDTLQLNMYCIDKSIYDYFFSLAQIVGNNGGFQSASPANPNTNLTGGALGYFSAHTYNEVRLLVY
jgi:hypothetical protein